MASVNHSFLLFSYSICLDHQPLYLRHSIAAGQHLPQEAGGPQVAQHGQPVLHPQRLQAMAGWPLHAGDCQKGRTVPESGIVMWACKLKRQNICVHIPYVFSGTNVYSVTRRALMDSSMFSKMTFSSSPADMLSTWGFYSIMPGKQQA